MTRTALGLLFGVLLACPGCFGGGVFYSRSRTLQDFSINSNIHRPSPNQPDHDSNPAGLPSPAYNPLSSPDQNVANPTEAQVRALWGEPDSSSKAEDGVVVWHYNTDLRWFGVMPMIFVPIPIVAPIGSNYSDIYFKDGKAVKATYSEGAALGGYYGPKDGSVEGSVNKWRWLE